MYLCGTHALSLAFPPFMRHMMHHRDLHNAAYQLPQMLSNVLVQDEAVQSPGSILQAVGLSISQSSRSQLQTRSGFHKEEDAAADLIHPKHDPEPPGSCKLSGPGEASVSRPISLAQPAQVVVNLRMAVDYSSGNTRCTSSVEQSERIRSTCPLEYLGCWPDAARKQSELRGPDDQI